MPIDRTQELQQRRQENMRAEMSCAADSGPIMEKLERLRTLNGDLETIQCHHLANNDKKSAKLIEKTIAEITKEGNVTRNMIIAFGNNTQSLQAKGSINASQASMRRNVFDNMVRKLQEVTKGSWDMQHQHDMSVTKQVEKRLKVRFTDANGRQTMSDEDVHAVARQLVESGREEQVYLMARDELDKAVRTRDAVRDLEKDMRDLYLIFCDLNQLVIEQSGGSGGGSRECAQGTGQCRGGAEGAETGEGLEQEMLQSNVMTLSC